MISRQNLHIDSKTYIFLNTFKSIVRNVSFGGCLSEYRWAFIVYMFRRTPEVSNWVSDNVLISGFGKVPMVFLKLFLRLPVVLLSSPLRHLEGFWYSINSSRVRVMRNDLIYFIEEGLFCLYNGHKTEGIWNYIFQRGQSSIVAIGPDGLCLVKICQLFSLQMTWHKIGLSKNCHISPSYTTGHSVSNDTKYRVIYFSHFSMMGTRNWCVTS